MRAKIVFVFLVVLVVAVSGCTNNKTVESAQTNQEPNFRHLISFDSDHNPENIRSGIKNRFDSLNLTYSEIKTINQNSETYLSILTPKNTSKQISTAIKTSKMRSTMNFCINSQTGFMTGNNRSVEIGDDYISIGDNRISKGQTKEIDDIKIRFNGLKEDLFAEGPATTGARIFANVTATAYTNSDIEAVRSKDVMNTGFSNTYSYRVPLLINKKSAERVSKLSQNYESKKGEETLSEKGPCEAKMHMFYQGEKLNSFTLSTVFQDRTVTTNVLSGSAETKEEASKKAKKISRTLQSSNIPKGLEIESTMKLE